MPRNVALSAWMSPWTNHHYRWLQQIKAWTTLRFCKNNYPSHQWFCIWTKVHLKFASTHKHNCFHHCAPTQGLGCNKSEATADLTVTFANESWYIGEGPSGQHYLSVGHFKMRVLGLWPINLLVDSLIWEDIKWQTWWCFCQRQAGEG